MKQEQEIQVGRVLAATSTAYGGVVVERHEYPRLQQHLYRLSVPGRAGDVWLTTHEAACVITALSECWRREEQGASASTQGDGLLASTRVRGEAA